MKLEVSGAEADCWAPDCSFKGIEAHRGHRSLAVRMKKGNLLC